MLKTLLATGAPTPTSSISLSPSRGAAERNRNSLGGMLFRLACHEAVPGPSPSPSRGPSPSPGAVERIQEASPQTQVAKPE